MRQPHAPHGTLGFAMSFGLGQGRPLDTAPGLVAVTDDQLGPLPDDLLSRPAAAHTDPRTWFPDPGRPFEIEIGSGKGTFLLQHAAIEADTNFLGIEWAKEFFAYAADRVRRRREAGELTNVRLLHADATEFVRWRCPDEVVRVVHLYFSDPWPKPRHHKKRVVQDRFMADVWRVLIPGGELRVVTDHPELWAWDQSHFQRWTAPAAPGLPGRTPAMPPAPFALEPFVTPVSAGDGELVGTNFERKFRAQGRSFYAATLRKQTS